MRNIVAAMGMVCLLLQVLYPLDRDGDLLWDGDSLQDGKCPHNLPVQAVSVYEEQFEKGLPAWEAVSGEWECIASNCLRASGSGWNILLLNTWFTGNWSVHAWLRSSGRFPVILAWCQDANNYLGIEIDRHRQGFRWVARLDGCPLLSEFMDAKIGDYVHVRIEKRRDEFISAVNVAYRCHLRFPSSIKPGRVGFMSQGRSGDIKGFRVFRLAGDEPPSSQETLSKDLSPMPSPSVIDSRFVIDFRDLDSLARSLAEQCRRDEEALRLMKGGYVAVTTFDLIDIPSPSVAQNVAEDLYTAMIKAGFRLVERGQLDKVLKELKVQSSGLIDPKAAQKIGDLTGADMILVGSISDRGNSVVINVRLMLTKTGQSIVAERIETGKVPLQQPSATEAYPQARRER